MLFSSGALQHTVHSSIIAAKIVSLIFFFFRTPIFRSRLEACSNKHSNTNPFSKKCRLRIFTNFCLIRVTCHLTTYQASRNRFFSIIFHRYLNYCGIFLGRFLVTIVLNIISSLHIVFSLCAQVAWCDVCTDFTGLINVDVDVDANEMSLYAYLTCAISKKQLTALHVARKFHLFNRHVFILLTKRPRSKLFIPLDIFSSFRGIYTLFSRMCRILLLAYKRNQPFLWGKGLSALAIKLSI